MRKPRYLLPLAGLIVLAFPGALTAQIEGVPPDFVTPLSGLEEVPIRVTDASGQALFKVIDGGEAISYRLIVEDISNVVASHIHLGPRGVNAPVVAFLFGSVPPGGGPVEGILAEGIITKANLTGPLSGQDLSVLIQAMRTGGTYVNVHTNDGVAPTDTGPGDFPGGEIRGQIRRSRDRSPRLEPQ